MPSSSHGSGGSHFGGGSSIGRGGSHFGGSRSSGSRVRTGPIFIHFGGHRYSMSSGKSVLMSFLIFINILLLFGGIGVRFSNYADELKIIEDDYSHYQSMVVFSQSHPEYTTTAEITAVSYNSKYKKYWYSYKFSSNFSTPCNGFTYCLYDEDDLDTIHVGATITIAIENKKTSIFPDCDSTPMDIINFSAKDDGEYIYFVKEAKQNRKIGRVILVLSGVMFVGNIVLSCVFFKKAEKTANGDTSSAETSSIGNSKPSARYCAYCGKLIPTGEDSCSACGAKVTERNDK